jgi:RNA 3'-terminal phosphate cyclase
MVQQEPKSVADELAETSWRSLSAPRQQQYYVDRIVLHVLTQQPLRIPLRVLHGGGKASVDAWQGPVASLLRMLRQLCHGLHWQQTAGKRYVTLYPGIYVGCVPEEHTADSLPLVEHCCDDLGTYNVTILLAPLLVLAPFGKQVTRVRFRRAVTENSVPESIDAFLHCTLPLAQACLGSDAWSALTLSRSLQVQLVRRGIAPNSSASHGTKVSHGVVLFECPVLRNRLDLSVLRRALQGGSDTHGRSVIQRLRGVVSTAGIAPTWGLRLIDLSRAYFQRWLSEVYISAVRVPQAHVPTCGITVWAESADNCVYAASASWSEDLDTFTAELGDMVGFDRLDVLFYNKLVPRLRRQIRGAGRADTNHHNLLIWYMALAPTPEPLQVCLGMYVAPWSRLLLRDLSLILGAQFHLQQDPRTRLWWLSSQGADYCNWGRARN